MGHDLKHFGTFCDTIFTPKEWFLSKKGPKEGERVARGHFHERVDESPVHWLPPGVGFTQKPFSVSENGPIENFLRSNSIFIGPESDHWLCLSVTPSLTHSLTHSLLFSKLVEVC